MSACRREKVELRIAQEVEDGTTCVALVSAWLGLCITPESGTMLRLPGVVFWSLRSKFLRDIELSCVYRRKERSPVLSAFLDAEMPDIPFLVALTGALLRCSRLCGLPLVVHPLVGLCEGAPNALHCIPPVPPKNLKTAPDFESSPAHHAVWPAPHPNARRQCQSPHNPSRHWFAETVTRY